MQDTAHTTQQLTNLQVFGCMPPFAGLAAQVSHSYPLSQVGPESSLGVRLQTVVPPPSVDRFFVMERLIRLQGHESCHAVGHYAVVVIDHQRHVRHVHFLRRHLLRVDGQCPAAPTSLSGDTFDDG